MTEKFVFRAGPYGGHYRHLTGPAGVGLGGLQIYNFVFLDFQHEIEV
jgi:hypothetical protein